MRKGCGCYGYALAVLGGLIVGLIGLSVAGWLWASARIFDPGPGLYSQAKWTSAEEAALAVKVAPVARAVRDNRAESFTLDLTSGEANRLFQEYLLAKLADRVTGEVLFGDTAMIIRYSRMVDSSRYVNGELRARVSGSGGDFTVRVYALTTGRFQWPKAALPEVGKWLEGVIETQRLWAKEPWRLGGAQPGTNGVRVEVKTVKH